MKEELKERLIEEGFLMWPELEQEIDYVINFYGHAHFKWHLEQCKICGYSIICSSIGAHVQEACSHYRKEYHETQIPKRDMKTVRRTTIAAQENIL